MRPSIAKQPVVSRSDIPVATSSLRPKLRPSNVPWTELEDALMCSVALAELMGNRLTLIPDIQANMEDDSGAGLVCLLSKTNRDLRAAFDAANTVHTEERKLS